MEKNFTYLIPANSAWDKINRSFASAYKILFTGLFPLQVHRHIGIGGTVRKAMPKKLLHFSTSEPNDTGATSEGAL